MFPPLGRKRTFQNEDIIRKFLQVDSTESFTQVQWAPVNDADPDFFFPLKKGIWDLYYQIEFTHRISGSAIEVHSNILCLLRDANTLDHIDKTVSKGSSSLLDDVQSSMAVTLTNFYPGFVVTDPTQNLVPWFGHVHGGGGAGSIGVRAQGGTVTFDSILYERSYLVARKVSDL